MYESSDIVAYVKPQQIHTILGVSEEEATALGSTELAFGSCDGLTDGKIVLNILNYTASEFFEVADLGCSKRRRVWVWDLHGGGGLHPGGVACMGVCIQGNLPPGEQMGVIENITLPWADPDSPPRALWDMVNKRAVRILLERILVCKIFVENALQ